MESPGQRYYGDALVKLMTQSAIPGMEDLKRALKEGLPEDDEMSARFSLALEYVDLALQAKDQLSAEQLIASPDFLEALGQAEKAILIDRQGQYLYFSDPLNRARLRPIDEFYSMTGAVLKDTKEVDGAIEYLQQKVGLLSFLQSNPLLRVSYSLGNLYVEKGQKESATVCYRNVVSSAPVDKTDEQGIEKEIRKRAAAKLNDIEAKPASSSKSGCFIATAVYGERTTQEILILQAFRDQVLVRTRAGRVFIEAYYRTSPRFAGIVRQSRTLRLVFKKALVEPAVWIAKRILGGRRYL